MGRGTRGGVKASKWIKALLLPASNFVPTSLSCFLGMMAKEFIEKLHHMVQDPRAIVIKSLNKIFLNGLTDLLDMELFRIVK